MAIEIRELVIRAVVAPEGKDKAAAGAERVPRREEIVAECVEEVLDILRRREER